MPSSACSSVMLQSLLDTAYAAVRATNLKYGQMKKKFEEARKSYNHWHDQNAELYMERKPIKQASDLVTIPAKYKEAGQVRERAYLAMTDAEETFKEASRYALAIERRMTPAKR